MANKNTINQSQSQKLPENKLKKNFCKRLMRLLFSHIGLFLIIILWLALGAYLFKLLETHSEMKNCITGKGEEDKKIIELRSKLLTYIQFNITFNSDNETVVNDNINSFLKGFREDAYENFQSNSYYGQDCKSSQWTLLQSLLFSLQAITTIGTIDNEKNILIKYKL
jgi:hypothetical protein